MNILNWYLEPLKFKNMSHSEKKQDMLNLKDLALKAKTRDYIDLDKLSEHDKKNAMDIILRNYLMIQIT